jgi:hypothetical protein
MHEDVQPTLQRVSLTYHVRRETFGTDLFRSVVAAKKVIDLLAVSTEDNCNYVSCAQTATVGLDHVLMRIKERAIKYVIYACRRTNVGSVFFVAVRSSTVVLLGASRDDAVQTA